MQGDQVKALILVSKAKGWDPTVIPARKGKPSESIENFNQPTRIYENQAGTGQLPQGIPNTFPDAEEPHYGNQSVTWNTPPYERENKDNSSSNGDPYAGMGGM